MNVEKNALTMLITTYQIPEAVLVCSRTDLSSGMAAETEADFRFTAVHFHPP